MMNLHLIEAHSDKYESLNPVVLPDPDPHLVEAWIVDPENLTKWLANPAEIKPGTFMPNLELTEKEINALIAYLGTLK